MLNLIKLLKKNEINRVYKNKGETIRKHKRYIPLSKEWQNSFYAFNKNAVRFLPAVHDYVFDLIKKYFNMTNEILEPKIRSREYAKAFNTSGRKVWVSTPEIKHLTDKMSITVYIYNKVYSMYKEKLNSIEFSWGLKYLTAKTKNRALNIYLNKNTLSSSYNLYVEIIKWLKVDKSIQMKMLKTSIEDIVKNGNKEDLLKELNLLKMEHYDYLINQLTKELIYLKLKQKMLFNKFKFNEVYLYYIVNLLQSIYNKKIEFSIVTLKYYYLSSSILSQIIVTKIIKDKNRGRALIPVYRALNSVRVPNLSGNKVQRIDNKIIGMQNIIFSNYKTRKKQDSLNKFLLANKSTMWSEKNIDNIVLNNLENKVVAGVFIKISGRLTKRFKAQRAMSRLRSKGTLRNVHSAYKGLSSVLSRGYANINVEKTLIHSKTRIGAFGLTGWVSSY